MLAERAPSGAPRKPPLSVFLMKVSGDSPDQTDTLLSPLPLGSFCSDFLDSVERLETRRLKSTARISPSPPLSGDIFLSRKVNLAYLDLKKVRRLWGVGDSVGMDGAAREFETGGEGIKRGLPQRPDR